MYFGKLGIVVVVVLVGVELIEVTSVVKFIEEGLCQFLLLMDYSLGSWMVFLSNLPWERLSHYWVGYLDGVWVGPLFALG